MSNPAPPTHCAACGERLRGTFYTLSPLAGGYCARCMTSRPRCASCGVPMAGQHWRLHDGRLQCPTCHATAVYDPAEARAIFDQTVAGLVAQLDLSLNVGVAFRIVDAPTLEGLRAEGNSAPPPGMITLGLYRRRGHIRAIYMLYGLPKLAFRTTVAHEYAHAWQGERCPLLRDEELREGHAEWVAYHHLGWLGCTKAAAQMLSTPHPYRAALERVRQLERQLGPAGVQRYLTTAE